MNLSPQERDKLLIFVAAEVARRRKDRGLKLNVPEAIAIITADLMEMARDGKSVAEIMAAGREILGRDDVMEVLHLMRTPIAADDDDGPTRARTVETTPPLPLTRSPRNRHDAV